MTITNIYALNLTTVMITIIALVILWAILGKFVPAKLWKIMNIVVALVSAFAILYFTVFKREPSDNHIFVWAAEYSNEFYREMLMNLFLYVPLGLSLGVIIGPWGILSALLLSLGVEIWQYVTGCGVAQATDLLCNTLGAVIGTIPYFIKRNVVNE